jgi:hypothetical protein
MARSQEAAQHQSAAHRADRPASTAKPTPFSNARLCSSTGTGQAQFAFELGQPA